MGNQDPELAVGVVGSAGPLNCGCREATCRLDAAPLWTGGLSDAVALFDDQRRFHDANPAAERLLETSRSDLIGHTMADLAARGHGFFAYDPRRAVAVDRAIALALAGRCLRDDETAVILGDGTPGVVSWRLDPVHRDGRVVGAALLVRDMTALSHATFLTAPVGMVRVRDSGELLEVNRAFQDIIGVAGDQAMFRPLREFLHPGDVAESDRLFAELIAGSRDRYQVEHRFRRADGALVWCCVTMTVPRRRAGDDGRTGHRRAIGVVQDITERKRLEGEVNERTVQLELLSRSDPLTGLFNRRHLQERLDELASMMRRRHGELAVLAIDIDRFKEINDKYGHHIGDLVIRTVGHRLRRHSRAEDVVGRWGGEEFLVVCPFTGLDGVRVLGERLRSCVSGTGVQLPGSLVVPVTMSVGAACGTADGIGELLHRADNAMHAAKAAGRDRLVAAG